MGSSIMSAFLVLLTAAASSALPQYPLPFNTLPHFPHNSPQQIPGFQFPQPVLPPWFNPGQMFLDEASLPAWLKPQEENEKENNNVGESDEASDIALSSDDNADSADDNADSADENADSAYDNADSADENADSADENADSADENADSADDNTDAAEVAENARFIDNTEAATAEGEGESATAVKKATEDYLKHRPSRPSTGYVTTGGYSGSYSRPSGYTTGYTGYSAYPVGYPSYNSGSSGYSGSLTYPSSGYTGGYSYPNGYTGGSTYTSGTSYPGYSGSSGFGGNTGYFTNTNGG